MLAALPFKYEKAPRRQLAMIRNAHSGGENLSQLVACRSRSGHRLGRAGTSREQETQRAAVEGVESSRHRSNLRIGFDFAHADRPRSVTRLCSAARRGSNRPRSTRGRSKLAAPIAGGLLARHRNNALFNEGLDLGCTKAVLRQNLACARCQRRHEVTVVGQTNRRCRESPELAQIAIAAPTGMILKFDHPVEANVFSSKK